MYSFLLKCSIVIALLSFSISGSAQQKYKLAQQYYNSGEYEKAAQLYESLYQDNPQNTFYFNLYIQCLIDLRDYETASGIILAELKKAPKESSLYVTYGNLLEKQGQTEKADQEYKKAILNLTANQGIIANLARTFTNLAKYDLAIETYLKGEKLTQVENLYVYSVADLYRRKGDTPEMIKYYIKAAEKDGVSENVLISLQRFLPETDFPELQKQLYAKIQEDNTLPVYSEMLEWSFLQQKDYVKALRQARALDRLLGENGARVFKIGELAYNDENYDAAIQAFGYIQETHGKNTTYYLESKRGLLNSKKGKVTRNYDYSQEDLISLQQEYVSFLDDLGRNTQTAQVMREYADFEALFINDIPKAISILEEVIDFGGLHPEIVARTKIDLANYYLMSGDRWEASLLYSQVDKDFKEGVVGEEARYRNARLSYYTGDFEWAQEQFKILKGATSKLISNDAIDMSVFILDHLGMDTTSATLQMFADAELLIYQNKFDEALSKLDSISIIFPDHSLEDDVLYVKAHIYKKLRQTDVMIQMYQSIIDNFKEDIRADNAMFELAEFYETQINKPEKARELYKTIFVDYSGSTFASIARQRYRALRGDEL